MKHRLTNSASFSGQHLIETNCCCYNASTACYIYGVVSCVDVTSLHIGRILVADELLDKRTYEKQVVKILQRMTITVAQRQRQL